MFELRRPTWAEINLDNLAFNFHSVRSFIGENVEIMAMVKADAYGHSAIECAKRLQYEQIDWFGVALPEEGLELRQNDIKKRILCLGSFWKGQEKLCLENKITPIIFDLEKAEIYNAAAKESGIVADIHVKIDTGMGRVGVRFDQAGEFAEQLKNFSNLKLEGLMTHFASADNLSENEFTDLQIERFNNAVKIFEEKGFEPKYKDLANSPGTIVHENSRNNLVRLGGILYGLGDDVLPKEVLKPELKPVLSLYTKIALLKRVPKGETLGYGRTFQTARDSLIATIPIGYQDGYNRILTNKSKVIVNGRFANVVGRISMDWTIIDVTDVPNVKIDDEVILIGKCDNLEIKAEDLAKLSDTISYEITCGINKRVWRKYVGSK
ncbi:MAG: alanine racemase [Pyrinomonadaceae bacterium]|nr:alanine racemase [Pyrinomonadaceae bacterium]